MTTYAIVDANGLIVNRVVLDDPSKWTAPDGHQAVEETQPMEIGATYVDGVYTPLPLPEPPPTSVPQSISDRQFFQQLAVQGIITEEQALASNAAVIPPPLLALIEQMPPDQQFSAKMLVSGATVFERNNPMTIAIGTAYGWSSEQIDALFVTAAAL